MWLQLHETLMIKLNLTSYNTRDHCRNNRTGCNTGQTHRADCKRAPRVASLASILHVRLQTAHQHQHQHSDQDENKAQREQGPTRDSHIDDSITFPSHFHSHSHSRFTHANQLAAYRNTGHQCRSSRTGCSTGLAHTAGCTSQSLARLAAASTTRSASQAASLTISTQRDAFAFALAIARRRVDSSRSVRPETASR